MIRPVVFGGLGSFSYCSRVVLILAGPSPARRPDDSVTVNIRPDTEDGEFKTCPAPQGCHSAAAGWGGCLFTVLSGGVCVCVSWSVGGALKL